MLKEIKIKGLRGFAYFQSLKFAIPNGTPGSGLTVVTGANNSGKSTVIEALLAVTQRNPPGFHQGRRNRTAGDKVDIRLTDNTGAVRRLRSVRKGSSSSEFVSPRHDEIINQKFFLPSRRHFAPYFGKGGATRESYARSAGFPETRQNTVNHFSQRLFVAERNRADFDQVLGKVLSPVPDWSIDQLESGQHFLKMSYGTASHSSEGLGEGLVSLFFIVDALYDSEPGSTIVIDEPELSLHPQILRKLGQLFTEYSTDRQIVISTHSPHFVNMESLAHGATVARVFQSQNRSRIAQLSQQSSSRISGMLRNFNNPHVFGLKAQEVFFLEDGIVLLEGQEDVVNLHNVLGQIGREMSGVVYGWGVGGAGNMDTVAAVLKDLGFSKVAGILDADQANLLPRLRTSFPNYFFDSIPADDIRTKPRRTIPAKIGLLDRHNKVRKTHEADTQNLIDRINAYLR